MGTRITNTGTDKMLSQANAIAEHLGSGWKGRAGVWGNDEDAFLDGPNGEELHVCAGRSSQTNGRMEIRGSLEHKHSRYNEPTHKITVSPEKAPARIAGDITRRLLPGYCEGLALAKQRKTDHDRWETNRDAMIETLAGMLPAVHRLTHAPDLLSFGGGKYSDRGIGGEVRVLSGDSMEWTLRTSGANARIVAELIAKVATEKA